MVLRCAVELGIPDFMQNHSQPITLSHLVASLHIHPSKAHCFYHLVRMLAHMGFFAKLEHHEEEEEKYSFTPAFLLHRAKRWPISIYMGADEAIKPWLVLSAWFKNSDKTVLETAHEGTMWDPENNGKNQNSSFCKKMATDSLVIATIMLRECRGVFEGVKSLVDVGGSIGVMADAIAKSFPHMKCIVFDLPQVVAGLQGPQNLDFVGGDMFEAMPPANVMLLKGRSMHKFILRREILI